MQAAATCGILECGFEYDREVSELVVSVIQGKNLVLSDNAGSFDSYVKVMLLPDKEAKHQTKVQRKTNNPVFKERFHFVVEPQQLDLRTVRLFVHGNDKFQRNVLIGDAEVKLSDVDLIRPFSTWFYLRDASVGKQNDLGDIMFSLSYLPTAERLTIVIVKARNLKYSDQKQNGDSFVKVYLLQNGKKINKKKTTTKRGECNPIFNEAMIFNVSAQILQSIQLRISISEMAADGEQLTVGHVIVGSSTSGKTLSHWNQMMTSLRKPIAMWHTVRK
ncbi:PREDICTED: synaptotagmin-12-like [Priapulus caudatus]|uniref:Synaptotagmin-12-like n=1 Tax=Priapulus caudatus TaxID=37621 RepID=A0ABM1ENW8_PRICU|nr:PREDICTED: synaptotagmin-12-like [Priapulus caudatus]